jgi:zinc-ribbon domain
MQEVRTDTEFCAKCNTELVLGSRFCHVCGTQRDVHPQYGEASVLRFLDIHLISQALGLTIASLVAFVFGLACVLAAIITGFVYTATTVLDWQAVQVWRIEWLLAAAVSFIAGILLKRGLS